MRGVLLLVVAGVLGGCTNTELQNYELDLDGQPDWLWVASSSAADFWTGHGWNFSINANSGLPVVVHDFGGNPLGETQWNEIQIDLTPHDHPEAFTQEEVVCIVAHELGHAIGMNHVAQSRDSLMSPKEHKQPENTCSWSEDDQKELCSADPSNSTCGK